jgi:hypothetical protein
MGLSHGERDYKTVTIFLLHDAYSRGIKKVEAHDIALPLVTTVKRAEMERRYALVRDPIRPGSATPLIFVFNPIVS